MNPGPGSAFRCALALVAAFLIALPAGAFAAEAASNPNLSRVVNFTILAALLVFAIRKPLASYLEARARLIREQLEEARADRQKAARAEELAARRSATLDEEVEAARRRIADAAVAEGRRIVAAAEEQARKISAAAGAELKKEVRAAERRLAAGAAQAAVRLARARLAGGLSDEDHRRLLNAGVAAIRSD